MMSEDQIKQMRSDARSDPRVGEEFWYVLMARAIESAATAPLLERIAALEQRNADLYEDVQRFKSYALDEKDARMALERELAGVRKDAREWRPIESAPRDGTNILIRFGSDGVSQGKYVPGSPYPWKFIDTSDGITWLINHAVDAPGGPSHWMPLSPEPAIDAALTPEQPK